MFQRKVSAEDVISVIDKGEVIENYPDDTPYPSQLILGWCKSRPLHVVLAKNLLDKELIVITAYEPDSEKWDKDFKRRLKI